MKKLFDWIVERTPQYKNLHCRYSELMVINENLKENAIKDCKDIQELKEKLEGANSELIIIRKQLLKIRTRANRLSKTNMYVQSIKQLIKEVL